MRSRPTVLPCLALACLALALPAAGRAAEAHPDLVETSIPTVFTGDLRSLPKAPEWKPGDPIKDVPRRFNPNRVPAARPAPPPRIDPLLALQEAAPEGSTRAFSTPIANFPGIPFAGAQPPDTVGDVGPGHYIQMLNSGGGSRFAIFRKSDGMILAGPTNLDSLGTGACTSGAGDPVVLYDPLADRWLMTEFTGGGTLCLYVSQTSDPIAGGWFRYQFPTPQFPDYPKYAVWPDAYTLTTNEGGVPVYAFDRARMLAGLSATMQRFTSPELGGFGFQALTPADLDGPPPPAGSPSWFMRHRDDEAHDPASPNPAQDFLEVFQLHVDFATPANSVLSAPQSIAVTEFDSDLCGLFTFSCIPQPSGSPLDPLREVIMHRLQYRNFGTHETLFGNLVTDVTGTDRAGIRWFELRRTGGGPWTLFQEGTYSLDATNRWMAASAMDKKGNVAIGYSVSSSSVFPGIRYAGRLATDPAGTLPQGEHLIQAGTGSNGSIRWGDYAAMSVDPVDDCTFWMTTEWSPSSQWATRIAALRFDGCLAAPSTGDYFTVSPCRVLDTRGVQGPPLTSGQVRMLTLHGPCGVPPTAVAVALNVTVVNPAGQGFLTLHPGNLPLPSASTINFNPGQTRANNAVVPLATDGSGSIAIFPFILGGGQADVVIDVSGYFE